jgi:uncharacterized membrane protein YphA (DoxX/SURF4 family)
MEILLLYLDNLDDFAGAMGLKLEMMRRLLLRTLRVVGLSLAGALAVVIGAAEPAFGLGAVTFSFVLWFYHRVTSPPLVQLEA